MSSITRVVIESIPHNEQRYPTVGDWQFDEQGTLHIRVSRMNPHYEMLVAIHELIEAFLATLDGVREIDVDNFDMEYERNRKEGDFSEPGDDVKCPVYRQHQIATAVEKILVAHLGIDWNHYNSTVEEL